MLVGKAGTTVPFRHSFPCAAYCLYGRNDFGAYKVSGNIKKLSLLFAVWALLAAETQALGEDLSQSRMRKDINFLASDQSEGRGVNTGGIHRAAQYIAEQFIKAGLKPAGVEGSFFQPFTIPSTSLVGTPVLALRGPQQQEIDLQAGLHFRPMGFSSSGDLNAPLIFVGYGI